MRFYCLLALALGTSLAVGCVVEERCYRDSDCGERYVCTAAGRCVPRPGDCLEDADCLDESLECIAYSCYPRDRESLDCPDDMAPIPTERAVYCMDIHEASHPEATAESPGPQEIAPGETPAAATSREGVLPWQIESNEAAQAACEAAGKRLCTPEEWEYACRGPDHLEYAYGNVYDDEICNGLYTFPDGHRLMPTGSFPECKNEFGVYDLNGNLWEHTLDGSDRTVRGGAYDCVNPGRLHGCGYIPETDAWTPSARGFRCCLGEL